MKTESYLWSQFYNKLICYKETMHHTESDNKYI